MIALLFPGQGSQQKGMLTHLAADYPLIQATFCEASEILGYDLWVCCQSDPHNQLDQTAFTQPILLTAGVALWRAWQAICPQKTVNYLAGHSLGEYTAYTCAGSFDFADALQIVKCRGEAMQAAIPADQGAMAAIIGLENEVVETLCQALAPSEQLSIANINAPGQVVVAGEKDCVTALLPQARAAGAKMVRELAVSVPSHTMLMSEAAKHLQTELAKITIHTPTIPVIANVDACFYNEADLIRDSLVQQLTQPVQWLRCMQTLGQKGVSTYYEMGPGNVLSKLAKRIDKTYQSYAVNQFEEFLT